MCMKLLTEHHLEFLILKGGITGWSEYTLIKMPHCWKSHVMAHLDNIDSVVDERSGSVVVDLGLKAGLSKNHGRHCVVSLSKTLHPLLYMHIVTTLPRKFENKLHTQMICG